MLVPVRFWTTANKARRIVDVLKQLMGQSPREALALTLVRVVMHTHPVSRVDVLSFLVDG